MILNEEEKLKFESEREAFKELVESEGVNTPKITDSHMRGVMYKVLNNTARELNEATQTGDIAQYTPVLMSLIRRTLPSMVGNQMVGVQAMSAPTGRIFAQHVYYGANKNGGTETWANGAVGTATAFGTAPDKDYTGPKTTDQGEALGWDVKATVDSNANVLTDPNPYPEMSFAIDYIDVSVKTRALKGKLTTEIVQDMKAVHGLDAESELVNILQAEITAELDRELVERIKTEAKAGAQNCTVPGVFNFSTDADGRWSMERIQGLMIQIEREATLIAMETRRGRGNFILTSPELAAHLSMANLISNDYGNTGFTPIVNPVGVSSYGKLCGRYNVFVDPYLSADGDGNHTLIVGYKGASAYDAGIFWCPYIPLQLYKAVGQEDYGQRIALKTRYGVVSNPYYCASGTTSAVAHTNSYYRTMKVKF